MARAASFHTDQTPWKLAEERDHLSPSQRPSDKHLACAADRVDVDLKDVLGKVEADRCDLHHDWLQARST
jgi:hypothetical protein